MDEHITQAEARANLGVYVDKVRLAGEHIVITRYGKPAAVIVPVEWLVEARAALAMEATR